MAWWRSKFTGVWLPLALFLLNFYVCRELFRIEYLDHMGSIEGAYIGISRWVIDHWRDLSWFPLWYGGIPYQDTYPPCLHWLVAIAASIFDLSPARAYHWVAALAYCGGPVTVYALAARLSKSKWIGFAAGLIYSSVSFSAWLIPAYAKDLAGWLHPRRLQTLVVYGDGPHVTALTLLPLALLFLDLAIERPRWFYVALAALAFAATALTNWLGAFALALALACYLLARGRIPMRAIAIVILAYALAMPWIPPSTIALIRDNSARVGGDFTRIYHSVWIWAPIVLAAIALLKFAIRKLEPHLQFAILFSSILTAIVLGAAYFRFQIVPQPDRYHLEMEMALAILLAFLGHAVFSHRPRAGAIALIILITLLIAPIRAVRDYAYRDLIRPIDIASTTEFQLAQWLNRHWNGQRIMTTGSSIYWLTAFSDTPEINGGFDQGETNEMIQVASYGVVIGQGAGDRGAEDSILWLKSLGVHAIAVAGPDSRELY
ncbi:MAG TPA: hypothetical protein VKS01_09325, partial [Bryobacteraceae bacterium]|nr:hypothetical protein [Bryobacteraceae bacterium]